MPHHARSAPSANSQLAWAGAAAACVALVRYPCKAECKPQDPRDSTRLPEPGAALSGTGPVASLSESHFAREPLDRTHRIGIRVSLRNSRAATHHHDDQELPPCPLLSSQLWLAV